MNPLDACTQLLLHFDELDGNFVDRSGRREQLAVKGSIGTSASSKFGTACLSDTGGSGVAARTAYVSVATNVPFYSEFWLNLTALPASSTNCVLGANVLYFIGVRTAAAGGVLEMSLYDSSNVPVSLVSPVALPLNQWVHVLVGVDETLTRRIFFNGVQQASSAAAVSHRSSVSPFECGIGGHTTDSFRRINGRLDELRHVYNYPCPSSDFTPPTAPYTDVEEPGAQIAAGAQRVSQTPTHPTTWRVRPPTLLLRDMNDGGLGRITGTVKEKAAPDNLPLRRRVRLFHEHSGRLVRETWSSDAGDYEFSGIDPTQRYTVLSLDHQHAYRAVVADNIAPEAMP